MKLSHKNVVKEQLEMFLDKDNCFARLLGVVACYCRTYRDCTTCIFNCEHFRDNIIKIYKKIK